MAIRKFRRGETTYTCTSCKKLTRNTGDEGQCRLCVDCFDLAGIENHLTDNGPESMVATYGGDVRRILGSRPELAAHFPELAAAINPPAAKTYLQEMQSLIKRGIPVRFVDTTNRLQSGFATAVWEDEKGTVRVDVTVRHSNGVPYSMSPSADRVAVDDENR